MKEHIKLSIWEKLVKNAAELLNLPVQIVDKEGSVLLQAGTPPFLCQILHNKRNLPCHVDGCDGKLKILRESLYIDRDHAGYVTIGPFRNEGSVPEYAHAADPGELKEEYQKLPVRPVTDDLRLFLKLITLTLADVGSATLYYKEKAESLELFQRVSHLVNPSYSLKSIVKNILGFFIEFPDAKNVAISLFDTGKIFTNHPVDIPLEDIEKQIHANIKNSNHPFVLGSLKQWYPESDAPYSLIALPLVLDDVLSGMILLLRSEQNLPDSKEMRYLTNAAQYISLALTTIRQFQSVHATAMTDKLTQVYNRTYFNSTFEEILEAHQKDKLPISLIMVDIDNFKYFNDTYGHMKGDEVLKQVADILKQEIRSSDILCRFGGEEFVVLLPKTKLDPAQIVAERLRSTVAAHAFVGVDSQKKVTISLGLATCLNSSLKSYELLKEADNALYKAKATGKNKVVSSVIIDRTISPVDATDADDLYVQKK